MTGLIPPRISVAEYRAIVGLETPVPAAAPALPGTPAPHVRALGHLPRGTMNKTEQRYAAHLDRLKLTGDVLWYGFEEITFHLAKRTSITVDFAVLMRSGAIEMHDVKGARRLVTDDARAKMKIAAARFPFPFRFAYPETDGFVLERVG